MGGQIVRERLPQRLFHRAIGRSRALRQMGGASGDMGCECGIRDRFIDHAPAFGLPGGDPVGEEAGAHGAGGANLARQPPAAPGIGDQADAGEGLHEAGAFGGDHHIGGEREIGPRPGRRAIDGGDGGQRAIIDRIQKRDIFLIQQLLEGHFGTEALGVGQILTGTEGTSGTGQDDHPRLGFRAADRLQKRAPQSAREGVHHLGAVEGDRRHPGGQIIEDRVHRCLPCAAATLALPSVAASGTARHSLRISRRRASSSGVRAAGAQALRRLRTQRKAMPPPRISIPGPASQRSRFAPVARGSKSTNSP